MGETGRAETAGRARTKGGISYFDNAVVDGTQRYQYDALYRLIHAEGREHKGVVGDVLRDHTEIGLNALPHPNQSNAVRNYEEDFDYDVVDNIIAMVHTAVGSSTASWTRHYDYGPINSQTGNPDTNRLRSTFAPGDTQGTVPYTAQYTYDAHGSMTAMPHLSSIEYDYRDQMRVADKGGGGLVYFQYDNAGQRVRKVWVHGAIVEERIYLSPMYEVYRKSISSTLDLERETLHVMDGTRRVAMVETKTVDSGSAVGTPVPRERYQLDNHLGTAAVELEASGNVFSYEEFHPFGTTSYRSSDSAYAVSAKRYRHTGKERDEETGLDYHGLRYKASWLARWSTADPLGLVDGPNLYGYVRGSPVVLSDPNGGQALPDEQETIRGTAPRASDIVPRTDTQHVEQTRQQFRQGVDALPGVEPLPLVDEVKKETAKDFADEFFDAAQAYEDIPNIPYNAARGQEAANEATEALVSGDADTFVEKGGEALGHYWKAADSALAFAGVLGLAARGGARAVKGTVRTAKRLRGAVQKFRTSGGSGPQAGGVSLTAPGDKFGKFAAKAKPEAGFTDVSIHGSSTSFWQLPGGEGPRLSHRQVARLLEADPSYKGGPIRLLSCNTGACGATAAQDLANKLKVNVKAPDNLVWAYDNGTLFVGPELITKGKPTGLPDLSKPGKFNIFTPRK